MNELSKEKMKQEAVKRMEAMAIIDETIAQFSQSDLVSFSRNGGNFWLTDKMKHLVSEFEEDYQGIVYYAILSNTSIGQMFSVFFVSEDTSTWSDDWQELKDGYQFVYVFNLDNPMFSEFGTIAFQPVFGGLVRTA